jgi:hypothetical protein
MIHIKVFDSYQVELAEGDVVTVTYVNKKIFDIGIVYWDALENELMIDCMNDGRISWKCADVKYTKIQIVGSVNTLPKLRDYCGRHKFKTEAQAFTYMDKMLSDILGVAPDPPPAKEQKEYNPNAKYAANLPKLGKMAITR